MRYINCLNNISAKGTDLLGSDYQLTDDIAQASGVLVRSAAMHDMDLPESLLAVARAGAGVNNIPLDKCAEAGVVVFNTPGANANAVKELVLCGMLLASRGILPGAAWCREHADSPTIGKDAEKAKKAPLKVSIPDVISVTELASRLKVTAATVVKRLMLMGMLVSANQEIDYDTAFLVADELGAKVMLHIPRALRLRDPANSGHQGPFR